jgi:hypothetical protein
MNAKNIIAAFLILLLAACTKSKYGRTSSWLRNGSAHKVIMTPYLRDSMQLSIRRTLKPGDSVEVYSTSISGKTIDPSWPSLLGTYDSIRVFFIDTSSALPPDTARIGHIRNGLSVAYPHHIPFSNNRSLYNEANWNREITEETKYMLKGRFVFTFTEQDYLNAR